MALEKRTSRLFGARISSIFSSHEHPHLDKREHGSTSHSTGNHSANAAAATNAPPGPSSQPLSPAPLVNLPHKFQTQEPVKSVPTTPQALRAIHEETSPESPTALVSSPRLRRKPPPPISFDKPLPSPLRQLEQLPGHEPESALSRSPRPQDELTEIIGTIEREIGDLMGTDLGITDSRPYVLRLQLAEPTDPLAINRNVQKDEQVGLAHGVNLAPPPHDHMLESPERPIGSTTGADSEQEFKDKFGTPYVTNKRFSPLYPSPSKDITQGPSLPAFGYGRRSMAEHDPEGSRPTDAASPLRYSHNSKPSLPSTGDFLFSNTKDNDYSSAGDSESVYSSRNTLHQHMPGAGVDSYHSASVSHENFAPLTLLEGLRGFHPTRSSETGGDTLSDLPAFFNVERSIASGGSKTNLDGIPENSDPASAVDVLPFESPGYPTSDFVDLLPSYSFGASTTGVQPRIPLKQTPTFASTDSGPTRTWSNSALLKNFHARMLLTSSITSSNSNRHVNLATLKRSFSLRPGEGDRSKYVETVRKNAGTSYNDGGPGKWKLPTGILPVDKKSLYLQLSNKFNRGGGALRATKTSGVELKHGHLQPRMLAAEVDDADDTNRFGSLGRSGTTATTKSITPVTSKSSVPSVLGGMSRHSSPHRSGTLVSVSSTTNDSQSLVTGDSLSKLSQAQSEVSSLGSDGSISEYKFGDGYYQHQAYNRDDDDLDTDTYGPATDDGTMNNDYDDDIDEEDEKPRLFLANPDELSDEN